MFNLDEITAACPQVDEIPGALNGFGLLQAVQDGLTNNITLRFVHYSMQEFLAVFHITCLSHYEEFCLLEGKFMSKNYAGMFIMYAGITKGQRPAFKQYLGGCDKWIAYVYEKCGFSLIRMPLSSIATNHFNLRFYLRAFRCLLEAHDFMFCAEIIHAIFFFFRGYILVTEMLHPCEVASLGLLLSYGEEWKGLYFYHPIDDDGIVILHQLLTNETYSTCIHTIHIGNNSTNEVLTQSSSHLITEIVKSCKTTVLEVFSPVLLLDDVVTLKTQLVQLLFYVEKSQTVAKTVRPVCLHGNKICEVLNLFEKHDSTNNSVEIFKEALKHNNVNECSFAQIKWIELRQLLQKGILKGIARLLHSSYVRENRSQGVFWF